MENNVWWKRNAMLRNETMTRPSRSVYSLLWWLERLIHFQIKTTCGRCRNEFLTVVNYFFMKHPHTTHILVILQSLRQSQWCPHKLLFYYHSQHKTKWHNVLYDQKNKNFLTIRLFSHTELSWICALFSRCSFTPYLFFTLLVIVSGYFRSYMVIVSRYFNPFLVNVIKLIDRKSVV